MKTQRPDLEQPGLDVRPGKWGGAAGYGVSLLLIAAVTLVGNLIFVRGNITNVGLLFLLPVMVAATRYGLRTGVATGLASSLAYNFFFIPPTHTLTIENPQNIITVLVLLGVAVVSSQLAARVRQRALLAQASAAQNGALAGLARQLTGISTGDELARVLCAEIGGLFDCTAMLLLPVNGGLALQASWPGPVRTNTLDSAAATWAFENGQAVGRGSDRRAGSEWFFQPVTAGGKSLGVFGISRRDTGAPIRPHQLPLLVSLLEQAGLALERIGLEQEMSALAHIRERDHLRHTLLSSVSHDLRTPLTTILGTLQAMRPLSVEQEVQLGATRTEAERLHRFVGNLLDMVRIEAGALHQSIEPVDLSEAVASAVEDLRGALQGHPLKIAMSADLPFVLVDPQLFHHCLINLIENAAKYGEEGSQVMIGAERDARGLVLRIEDEGPGIVAGDEERIFETFARIEGSDRKGGTGLGLAIVMGFAQAMGLDVSAANRHDRHGACFAIRFDDERLRECPTT